jgi:hypothetical protein
VLAVSKSGYGWECMGSLYLGQDRSMRILAGCIMFRIGVCGYRLNVSRSRYDCEYMGWHYLRQDMGVCMGCLYLS